MTCAGCCVLWLTLRGRLDTTEPVVCVAPMMCSLAIYYSSPSSRSGFPFYLSISLAFASPVLSPSPHSSAPINSLEPLRLPASTFPFPPLTCVRGGHSLLSRWVFLRLTQGSDLGRTPGPSVNDDHEFFFPPPEYLQNPQISGQVGEVVFSPALPNRD